MDSVKCEKCGKDYPKKFKSCPECYFRELKLLENNVEGEGSQQCMRCGNIYETKYKKCPYCSRLNVTRTFFVFLFIIALLTMIFISLRFDYIKSRAKVHSRKVTYIHLIEQLPHATVYSERLPADTDAA